MFVAMSYSNFINRGEAALRIVSQSHPIFREPGFLIYEYDRSVMLFELDLRVRVLQVGTSAFKSCDDIVLKGLKINSWGCHHYEIGARVGESGGRTAKNELNHGK